MNEVPFPAYESFVHRQNLPRRFFLFFDKIYRAGRHNKELWATAVKQNKGLNDISFGTNIFEAHILTVIQENYFAWMFQALSNSKIVPNLDQFKTEYDFDELPDELACGCSCISALPTSCELWYDTTQNVFQTVHSTPRIDSIKADQQKYLQDIINKHKQTRRETLKDLRDRAAIHRPRYLNFSKEERGLFNLEAKKAFRLFIDAPDKENANQVGIPMPPNKKQRRSLLLPTSQKKNKCRVSNGKLDFFKSTYGRLSKQDEELGLRSEWERIYKYLQNKYILDDQSDDDETPQPKDFLKELLGSLKSSTAWKTTNARSDSSDAFENEHVAARAAV